MRNLFLKYLNNTITDEELKILCHYSQIDENDVELDIFLKEYFEAGTVPDNLVIYDRFDELKNDSWKSIEKRIKDVSNPIPIARSFKFKFSVAASLLLHDQPV